MGTIVFIDSGTVASLKSTSACSKFSAASAAGSYTWDFSTDFAGIAAEQRPVTGDVVVIGLITRDGAANDFVAQTPATWTAGFSAVDNSTDRGFHSIVKKIDGSETTVKLCTNSEAQTIGSVMFALVYQGGSATPTVHLTSPSGAVTPGNPSSIALAASGGTPPLVKIAMYVVESSGSITDVEADFGTDTADHILDMTVGGTYQTVKIKEKVFLSSPTDSTVDQADEGGINNFGAMWFEF